MYLAKPTIKVMEMIERSVDAATTFDASPSSSLYLIENMVEMAATGAHEDTMVATNKVPLMPTPYRIASKISGATTSLNAMVIKASRIINTLFKSIFDIV